jgi:hypothetical protein
VTNTSAHESFGLFVDQCTYRVCTAQGFAQGMQVAMAMLAGAQPKPYVASAESGSLTRQALGAMGVENVPGPRSRRLSAAERAQIEATRKARAMGFERGRFVG